MDMDLSAWLDASFQHSEMQDIDAFVNAALCAFPFTPTDNGSTHNIVPTGDLVKTSSSLEGALLEYPPQYRPLKPPLPPLLPLNPSLPPLMPPLPPPQIPKRGPIYNIPVEILITISRFVAPPRTRDGLYELSKLTHICRFWRMALINQPRMWSAVFITQDDRRSFVDACLERSHPVTLDVTVEARKLGETHPNCACDKGVRDRLLPNESAKPCEWHFQFELLAQTKHSSRIQALDIEFESDWASFTGKVRLALGGCRFFTATFPRLVSLTWRNEGMSHADYLFSTPPFVPTLRSLTYVGGWNSLITRVNNLTSFEFEFDLESPSKINTEAFRLLMCNNRSLESLDLRWIDLEGDTKGPPAHLLKLKSLTLNRHCKKLSTTIRIPAFQRLSSLRISLSDDADMYTISATGDGITISAECYLNDIAETWEDLTGYAKPVIRHVRLYDGPHYVDHYCSDGNNNTAVALLMMDAQTLEVGANYLMGWYRSFWEDLKQLGTQLKTIRFEVSEEMEPCRDYSCMHDDGLDCDLWDTIEDLVRYRFDQGRPFSAVERMVVSEIERENRSQAFVWRCFYGTRKLGQYVRPVVQA